MKLLAESLFVAGGLVGCAATSAPIPSAGPAEGVSAGAALLQPDRAWADLAEIAAIGGRHSGGVGNLELRALLAAKLRGMGLEPVLEAFRAETPIGEIDFCNVYADLTRDAQRGAPWVVLAAHFDTKRLPFEFEGANDGASGTALLLELARTLSESRAGRRLAYRFLFLDGEEATRPTWAGEDNCYGSRHHVEALGRDPLPGPVAAFVLMDMVGDADLALEADLNSSPELLRLFFDAAEELGLGGYISRRPRSVENDHQRFLEAGIPSVCLIDFSYGVGNAYWHSREDTVAKCDVESLRVVGEIILGGLARLSD